MCSKSTTAGRTKNMVLEPVMANTADSQVETAQRKRNAYLCKPTSFPPTTLYSTWGAQVAVPSTAAKTCCTKTAESDKTEYKRTKLGSMKRRSAAAQLHVVVRKVEGGPTPLLSSLVLCGTCLNWVNHSSVQRWVHQLLYSSSSRALPCFVDPDPLLALRLWQTCTARSLSAWVRKSCHDTAPAASERNLRFGSPSKFTCSHAPERHCDVAFLSG
jgi:hypothetical protein